MCKKIYSNKMINLYIFFLFFLNNTIFLSHASDIVSAHQALSTDPIIVASGRNIELGFLNPGDSISANQSLTGNLTLVSSGGNFELGFFTPGNSSKYYIGIWFKKVWKQTVVWVANRETPILDKTSAQLKILDGNLVLLNESQSKIWSTNLNSSTTSNNTVIAVLLDTGNLVLKESLGLSRPLWESFDNPTDTWMPRAKFGYDRRTQKKQVPTCWKNSQDPASGLFSMEFDPNGSEFIALWNRSEQYWTSGSWKDNIFKLVPEMRMSFGKYNVTYVDNENESYCMYWPYDQSVITRLFMDSSGQLKHLTWTDNTSWNLFFSQPRQQCEAYAYCGPFSICDENSLPFCSCLPGFKIKSEIDWSLKDYSGGCVREISLQCEKGNISNGRKDRFLMNSNIVRLPEYSQSLMMIGGVGECESACLSNCSCMAYAYDENGCSVWNGELLNVQQLAKGGIGRGKSIYIRVSPSSSMFSGSKKNNNKGLVIGAVAGSSALVLVIMAMIVARLISSRERKSGGTSSEGFLVAFRYKDVQNATKNFSDKLGGGGFGSVFKGVLPDSSLVAVKKLESITQGEKQFRTEVSTIGIIQHFNLVRLRGFCAEGTKKLLVYDYMENGSLDSHLFNAKESDVILKWKTRYQIALGIAKGLTYLHENCEDCIIHCDIKPQNILLDAELHPKVADFGLAKLVGRDFSRVLTTMRGTVGYLAPEWLSGVAITTKADVYSYGMMLFELVSGKRNSTDSENENVRFFPYLAAKVMIEGGDILELLDHLLEGEAEIEEVSRICKVACWCIQGDENIRPCMAQVVQILEGIIDVNLPPIPRWLQVLVESQHHSF